MTKKRLRTPKGARFLAGPRLSIDHRRKRPRTTADAVVPYVATVDGRQQELNKWESRVAWALEDLDEEFIPQAQLGPPRALGGASVDFLLPLHKIALEVQGPFHSGIEGAARDFWRQVTRETYGYRFEEITEHELDPTPHKRLQEIIGFSGSGRR